jgi:hypothetical protein
MSKAPRLLGALVVSALIFAPGRAFAQPCCAGASALSPGRLAQHEDALAGFGIRSTFGLGSFDGERRFSGNPGGSAEIGLEQDFFWTVRALRHAQVSLLVPFVETFRRTPSQSDMGGGLGDAQLGLRYDFSDPGASRVVPGIAAVASLTFPTGRAPEAAASPLATDATGTGVYQGSFGVALEQTFGHAFANVVGSVTLHSARSVGPLETHRGPALFASAAGGYSFDNTLVLALGLSYTAELAGTIDGAGVPNGGHAFTRVSVSSGFSFTNELRIQGNVFTDLPIDGLGWNQPASMGLFLMVIRSWS